MNIYDELYQQLLDIQDDVHFYSEELKYMRDFLSWRHLWDDFADFRENAHLEQAEDEPFPRYIL